jgi:outer membrane immunogenic protein
MYDQEHYLFSTPPLPAFSTASVDTGGRGWLGRVGVGCDYQFNQSFVVGAFGDYDWRDIKGNFQDTTLPISGEEKNKSAWHAGVRVGWLPYSNLLTFVSGGWTQAKFDGVLMTDNFGIFPANVLNFSFPSNTYDGWFIGGGYEYQLPFWQGLSWKTEYRFASYKADDLPVTVCIVNACGSAFYDEHMKKYIQTVTTSLVWRFNFGGPGYGFGGPRY